MKANYKNWVPKGMVCGYIAGAVLALLMAIIFFVTLHGTVRIILSIIFLLVFIALCLVSAWSVMAYLTFSYDGKIKLSKRIVEATADKLTVPEGGKCLDVGCGSGALTIAVAKKNPNAEIIGVDRWGKEYASFSRSLCKSNAVAEGVENVKFKKGDATSLPFEDELFDAVCSNYVYHNIPSRDRQAILLETLRTLKKGGYFVIHDIFSKNKYGDMQAFIKKLYDMGYESAELIETTDGMFMEKSEARRMMLQGSALLIGRK